MRKQQRGYLLGLVGALLGFCTSGAFANFEVSATVQIRAKADFHAPLGTHGTWVEVGSYGRCWRPKGVAVGWRPYCTGNWVWTDCGWYWASDEPWAWACYHYGYWVDDPSAGWVWVPEVEWAPAWVSWRVGGGYVGWAPLPPPGIVFIHHAEPSLFVFVKAGHLGDPVRPGTVVVKNTAIFKATSPTRDFTREKIAIDGSHSQRVVVNRGPGVEVIEKAGGRKFAAVSIQEAARRTPGPAAPKVADHEHAAKGDQSEHTAGRADKSVADSRDSHAPDDSAAGNDHGSRDDSPRGTGGERARSPGRNGHGKH
jgi:hypothetical protein